MSTYIPVILAGGAGRRLAPISSPDMPKQFHSLIGEGSLLQQAATRSLMAADAAHIITVTNTATCLLAASQLAMVDEGLYQHLIAEPHGRNTAAALATAALYAQRRFDNPLLWVQPSDHYIENSKTLLEDVCAARHAAESGYIVTFGITPQAPLAQYGYIVAQGTTSFAQTTPVQQFIEKPEEEVAAALIKRGNCFWNSGMFLASAETLLGALHAHAPIILELAESAFAAASESPFIPHHALYEKIPALPIDKAVMEHSDKLLVMPARFDWADIGHMDSLRAARARARALSGSALAETA